jgi:hypothetical protein
MLRRLTLDILHVALDSPFIKEGKIIIKYYLIKYMNIYYYLLFIYLILIYLFIKECYIFKRINNLK